jgi:cyclopropane-fatty-acyl-phospholipid synthase
MTTTTIPLAHDPAVPLSALEKLIDKFGRHLPPGAAFEYKLPGRPMLRAGEGQVQFRLTLHNDKAVAALKSLDEMRIGEAYLFGDLSIEGDLVAALDLRSSLTDRHLLLYLWSNYGQKLFRGQVRSDTQWISEHYDAEPDFYLTFLDRKSRCYSHAYFVSDDEPLETATQRKLDTAIESCGIRAGWRVLDIGAGWGTFTEYAGRRGVQVTSLTISKESEEFVNGLGIKLCPCTSLAGNDQMRS